MNLFSKVEITAKIINIYPINNGKMIRLMYHDCLGFPNYVSAIIKGFVLEKFQELSISKYDIVSIVGELLSYSSEYDTKKITLHNIRVENLNLITKEREPF